MRRPSGQPRPGFALWLETDGARILDAEDVALLEAVRETGSIIAGARRAGRSYKYAWDRLAALEHAVGEPVLVRRRGGATGGGGATLTPIARTLLREYGRLQNYLAEVIEDTEYWEAIGLKLSARNRLKGTVKAVKTGVITCAVKIEVKTPVILTAVITTEAVDDLALKVGDRVEAIVKSTEVLIAK